MRKWRQPVKPAGNKVPPCRLALVANKNPSMLRFVASVLRNHEDMNVVGVAQGWDEGLTLAQNAVLDVAVVDLSAAGMAGLEALDDLRRSLPEAGIVAIGRWTTRSARQATLGAGANVLLPKANVERGLVSAIRGFVQSKQRGR